MSDIAEEPITAYKTEVALDVPAAASDEEDTAFKNIEIEVQGLDYFVTFDVNGDFKYSVEDGHSYLIEETEVAIENEDWVSHTLKLSFTEEQIPDNGTMMLALKKDDVIEFIALNK